MIYNDFKLKKTPLDTKIFIQKSALYTSVLPAGYRVSARNVWEGGPKGVRDLGVLPQEKKKSEFLLFDA